MVVAEVAVTHLIFQTLGIEFDQLDGIIFVRQKGNNLEYQLLECEEIKRTIAEKMEKSKPLLLEELESDIRLA